MKPLTFFSSELMNVIAIMCVSIVSSSCSDNQIIDKGPDDCDSSMTLLIPDSIYSRHFHPKGTYWIYKNESTGYLDSQWVDYTEEYMLGGSDGPCSHSATSIIESPAFGRYRHELNSSPFISPPNSPTDLFDYYANTNGIYVLRYQVIGGKYVRDRGSPNVSFRKSMTINDLEFSNLTVLWYDSIPPNRDIYKEMVYADSVGLISFVDLLDVRWNLVRFQIRE